MQMHDLPTFLRFVQDDSSSIEEPWSIVEMEGRDRYVPEQLYPQFLWLDVHVWSCNFVAAYLLEHSLESPLEFSTARGTLRHRTRIEHRGIVIEREPEMLPIQVIEGPNEMGERLPYIRIWSCGFGLSENQRRKEQDESYGNADHSG